MENANLEEEDLPREVDLQTYKTKAKPKKKTKQFLSILGVKTKRKKSTSDKQKIIDKVISSRNYDNDSIASVANTLGFRISNEDTLFIQAVAKSKIVSRKITIPAGLFKKPITYFTQLKSITKCKYITNDFLFWGLHWYKDVQTNAHAKMFNNTTKVVEINIISDQIEPKTMQKGYIQDKSEFVCAINCKNLTNNEEEQFANLDNDNIAVEGGDFDNGTFDMSDGLEYVYRVFKSNVLIYTEDEKRNAANIWKNQIYISPKSLDKNLDDDKQKVKLEYLNYHNQTLTSFIPSILIFEVEPSVKVYAKVELNYNDLYDQLFELFNGKKSLVEVQIPKEIVLWETFHYLFTLISLINNVDGNKYEAFLKQDIDNFMKKYEDLKGVFMAWKSVYMTFKQIILGFHDALTTKITIDSIVKLKPKIAMFLSEYDALKKDSTYVELVSLMMKIPNSSKIMMNFCSGELSKECILVIDHAITAVMTNDKQYNEEKKLFDLFAVAGIYCKQVLYGGTYEMIMEIRSPAAFLGNLNQGTINSESIKAKIIEIKNKIIRQEEKRDDEIMSLVDTYKEAENSVREVLKNTLIRAEEGKFHEFATPKIISGILDNLPSLKAVLMEEILAWFEDDVLNKETISFINSLTFEEVPMMKAFLANLNKVVNMALQKMAEDKQKGIETKFNVDDVAAPAVTESAKIPLTRDSIRNKTGRIRKFKNSLGFKTRRK